MSTTSADASDVTPQGEVPRPQSPGTPQAAKPLSQPASSIAQTPAAENGASDTADAADEPGYSSRFWLFNALPSSLVSGVLHFVVFLILALWTIEPPQKHETLAIRGAPPSENQLDEPGEELPELRLEPVADRSSDLVQQVLQDVVATTEAPSVVVDVDAAPLPVELSDFGEQTAPKSDLMATVGALAGSGLASRGAGERGQMVATVGGTTESEAAVAAALKWFSEHQNKDGSWNFDHRLGPCQGRCTDPGMLSDCRTGATAMALLPFLGAGQTHKEGQYKEQVEKGLYFLTHQMKVRKSGDLQTGDLTQPGGSLYAHGLAAITLCEAYAMTQDRKLMGPAQLSLNYIVFAQDPVGGGWRYVPRQAGDTSVVGWQLMALKSGHMAYLNVPAGTIQGATRFLDSMQADGGAKYGYTGPGQGDGTTAVGLLCRMYLGWKQDNPALKRGVESLSRKGPSRVNMYYNYYATQVMRQYCGDPGSEGHEMWEKWNANLRDALVRSQEKTGHAKGSWVMKGDHGSEKGGRLYCTSMATMILEVYYRHMPIYGKQASTEEFPL